MIWDIMWTPTMRKWCVRHVLRHTTPPDYTRTGLCLHKMKICCWQTAINLAYICSERGLVYYYRLLCINTTFYDRGHVSDALPSLRGNALPRHERGHKMLYLCNNLYYYIPYQINRNRNRNSFNYIYIRKMNQNSNDPQPYLTHCDNCSSVVA